MPVRQGFVCRSGFPRAQQLLIQFRRQQKESLQDARGGDYATGTTA
jgi:hypothetical protein